MQLPGGKLAESLLGVGLLDPDSPAPYRQLVQAEASSSRRGRPLRNELLGCRHLTRQEGAAACRGHGRRERRERRGWLDGPDSVDEEVSRGSRSEAETEFAAAATQDLQIQIRER